MATKTINLVKDPSGSPAVDLTKLRGEHPDLVKRAEKAGISLSKRGLDGVRAQAVLVLDHSGSMRSDYRNGTVQTLVERALGFALQIDVDGSVPVIPFDSKVYLGPPSGLRRQRKPYVVDVNNYRGIVNDSLWKSHEMGATVMSTPLNLVSEMADSTDAPIFLMFVGDGSPNRDDKNATTEAVIRLAEKPVFIKFLAIRPVEYLQDLDDLPADRRLLDNVDAKFLPNPATMSDLEFADAMVDEWDTWIVAARGAGVLA